MLDALVNILIYNWINQIMTNSISKKSTDEMNESRGLAVANNLVICFLWDGFVRKWYQIKAGNIDLQKAGAIFERNRLKLDSYRKLTVIGKFITYVARKCRKKKLRTKTSIELQKSAKITNKSWNKIGKYARRFGTVIIIVSLTHTIYVIACAQKGKRIQKTLSTLVPTFGGFAGSYLGSKATGLIITRTVISSLAPLIGATIGVAGGFYLGISIGSWVVRQSYSKLSKRREAQNR
jgi:hypothetical protein